MCYFLCFSFLLVFAECYYFLFLASVYITKIETKTRCRRRIKKASKKHEWGGDAGRPQTGPRECPGRRQTVNNNRTMLIFFVFSASWRGLFFVFCSSLAEDVVKIRFLINNLQQLTEKNKCCLLLVLFVLRNGDRDFVFACVLRSSAAVSPPFHVYCLCCLWSLIFLFLVSCSSLFFYFSFLVFLTLFYGTTWKLAI